MQSGVEVGTAKDISPPSRSLQAIRKREKQEGLTLWTLLWGQHPNCLGLTVSRPDT